VSSDVEYLNSRDATIMGSRNGHAPIYMWYTFTRKGYEGLRKDVEKCLRNAHLLKVGGWVAGCWGGAVRCAPNCSCTARSEAPPALLEEPLPPAASLPSPQPHPTPTPVLFAPLSALLSPLLQSMLEKAGVKTMLNELSSTVVFERPREEAFVRKWQLACEGDIAHVVVMPNITIRKLETFVQELFESRWVFG
jgi:hypothetical protein